MLLFYYIALYFSKSTTFYFSYIPMCVRLFLIILLLLSYRQTMAQELASEKQQPETQQELYIGYGLGSVPVIANAIVNLIGDIFVSRGDETQVLGPLMAGYTRSLSDRVSVGAEASYTSFTSRYSATGELDYRNNFYVLMPEAKYYWAKQKTVSAYSGAKAGLCYIRRYPRANSSDDTRLISAFQVDVIGVRVGRKAGFYVETGFGYDGFLHGGINVRL